MAIKFDGEFSVPVGRDQVYAVLSDPEQFAPLLPTYHSLSVKDDRTADVTVKIGVGKVRGKAHVTLTLEEDVPTERAAYSGKGKVMGGAFNLTTAFQLEDGDQGGTLVKWEGDLTMFGKLVSLAGGLIKPIAKKDIGRLVDAIQASFTPDSATTESG